MTGTDDTKRTPESRVAISTEAATPPRANRPWGLLTALFAIVGLITFGVTALLVTIFEHRQEARTPFVRLVEVNELTSDPAPWGVNWPFQFDSYQRTVDDVETEHGGSSALPASKLEKDPWLRRLYAGYAFSLDYREARGHAYMLLDQQVTERVTKRPQAGACLHCHASVIPTYRRLGLEENNQAADASALAADFNWPAVMAGFRAASRLTYAEAHAELLKTPDGTHEFQTADFAAKLDAADPANQTPPADGPAAGAHAMHHADSAHPVSCLDCHDPESMRVRVTRPGFMVGIAELARSDDPVPHLPSIRRWREGSRSRDYDPNLDASRQEMRSFVCGQCHVEYYCATKETLFYPWNRGLKVEQMEQAYEEHKFPDGSDFYDYEHGETGAHVYKAQHPEFELWSQGVHARSGVSCADCHMPYERQGAMKVSSHWVRSPLLSINRSCQTCHNVPEDELRERVKGTQARTEALLQRAAQAMTEMLDAIREAKAGGATTEQLSPILDLQRKAMWRLDFISSENSQGFHADQEAARILGESIDFSRQAQVQALRLRAPTVPTEELPAEPVLGVTPRERPAEEAPKK